MLNLYTKKIGNQESQSLPQNLVRIVPSCHSVVVVNHPVPSFWGLQDLPHLVDHAICYEAVHNDQIKLLWFNIPDENLIAIN